MNTEERLARIEERQDYMLESIQEFKVSMRDELAQIKVRMDGHYVSKDEFEPVKMLVYGLVGVVMSAVILALVMLLMKG